MSLVNLNKKKREVDASLSGFEHTDTNMNLKVNQVDGSKYRIKGSTGYETLFLKKQIKEGTYVVGIDDAIKDAKKSNPKACFRIGVYCQTEDEEKTNKSIVYCLGSCGRSIALRSSDDNILHDGEVIGNKKIGRMSPHHSIEAEGILSSEGKITNELFHDYYIVVSLQNPKNPEMIKYYKDKIEPSKLFYSQDSFVSFFKGGQHISTVTNLREGVYSIGVSLYMEASVVINLDTNSSILFDSISKEPEDEMTNETPNVSLDLPESGFSCSKCYIGLQPPKILTCIKPESFQGSSDG